MTESLQKTELRHRFSALRNELAPAARAEAETAIREALFSLPVWKTADLICGYASMKGEIDLSPVWSRAISEGKEYALPVTVTDAREGRMIFRRLTEYAPEKLTCARFGVREPSSDCPTLTWEDYKSKSTLVIVPALSFDDQGFRLGYGGGYYDRFLAALSEAGISVTAVGLVFSVCHTQVLPRETHDRPVDYIIDERRVIRPHGIK